MLERPPPVLASVPNACSGRTSPTPPVRGEVGPARQGALAVPRVQARQRLLAVVLHAPGFGESMGLGDSCGANA